MSTYLVTGGAGFIGSHIVAELVERGETVRVLDNFSTGRLENIAPYLDHIDLIEDDVRHLDVVRAVVKDASYVLHQAALPSVPRSIADPLSCYEVNTMGTLNVLIAARDAGVERVVYASSSSIYGDTPVLPKRENMAPNPLSPYAAAKLAGENCCKVFFEIYGLPTVRLRYFNVFGPRQDPTSQYAAVIPKFIAMMLNGKQPTIFGDGLQSRDFTYVDNVVYANLLAAHAPSGISGTFNAACGERHTLLSLVATLNNILGLEFEAIYGPPQTGDVKHSQASLEAISRALSYQPQVCFEEGLRRTVAWFTSAGA
jgi:UDP-glucose 4-epimerase